MTSGKRTVDGSLRGCFNRNDVVLLKPYLSNEIFSLRNLFDLKSGNREIKNWGKNRLGFIKKMSSSTNSGVTGFLRNGDGGGIPRNCRCGAKSKILTSESVKNPGRLFYRCPYGSKENKNHLFKWTDIAMNVQVDVGDMKAVVAGCEKEISELKDVVSSMEKEITELKQVIKYLKYVTVAGIVVGLFMYFC
ncbi:hypothetical protein N665_3828s0001 [Sinapis alba]|nr:hypothetical protein N665_3828s0001 [Sinapis alba]